MYKSETNISRTISEFKLKDRMFRYSSFIPRFYNYCKSLGLQSGKMMPSRAFCSDESQGYPIILMCKHFGTFPFNHGLVGGVVATDRHGPHAQHGKDMVIIQASHVGYDPDTSRFGVYRRLCTVHSDISSSCGKIDAVLDWYRAEYQFAQNNILIEHRGGDCFIIVDNQLLNMRREEGIFLHLDKLIEKRGSQIITEESHSTSKYFKSFTITSSHKFNFFNPEKLLKEGFLKQKPDKFSELDFLFGVNFYNNDIIILADNRMMMGDYRYGSILRQNLDNYDVYAEFFRRLKIAKNTKNLEYIVDAYNMLRIEYYKNKNLFLI